MARDDHVALLNRGVSAWNAWRADYLGAPDLSSAALRALDFTGFDFSRTDFRGADLRGTKFCNANLTDANLDGANFFKAVLDGADLSGTALYRVKFLNCAQLVTARNWQSALRDDELGCGAAIPKRNRP
jgi:uncharacterized protein YjbI with pentapeptide repeats